MISLPLNASTCTGLLLNELPFAGLKEGDIVLSFNGEAIGKSSGDKVRWFQSQIRSSPGLDIDLTIDRNGQRMPIHVIPSTSATTGNGIIGTNLEVCEDLRFAPTRSWSWISNSSGMLISFA